MNAVMVAREIVNPCRFECNGKSSTSMEVLKALAHPSNQAIMIVLAAEPSYARRIATLVDITESEVTRRLRSLEQLGIVTSSWEHIGRNVKMYKPAAVAYTIRFDAEGMHVNTEQAGGASHDSLVDPFEPRIPEAIDIVGRGPLIEQVRSDMPVVGLEGLAGIGKTSILAQGANAAEGPVFWHSFRGIESTTWLLNRLAVFLAAHGHNDLVHAIHEGAELAERRERLLEFFDQPGLHYYFDDLHWIGDDPIKALLRDMAASAKKSRVRMASREALPIDAVHGHVQVLGGLEGDAVRQLLASDEVTPDDEDLDALAEVGGHPLALHLLADVSTQSGRPIHDILKGAQPDALVDFLLREVDEGLSEHERRVMAHGSLFREGFTMDKLRWVTKAHEATLLGLRRKHLVELRGDRYTLHDLVRAFFHGMVDDAPRQHAKIASRYQENETLEGHIEALHHLLEANDQREVRRLLQRNLDLHEFDLVDSGYTSMYRDLLNLFKRKDVDEHTWALIQDELGDIHFQRGEYEAALQSYEVADAYFQANPEGTRDEDIAWKSAMAHRHLGNEKVAVEIVDKALETAPEDGVERERLEDLAGKLSRD